MPLAAYNAWHDDIDFKCSQLCGNLLANLPLGHNIDPNALLSESK